MKHNKFLAVVMALALVIVLFTGTTAFADGGIDISLSQDGNTVTVTVIAGESVESFQGIRFHIDAPEGFAYDSHSLNGNFTFEAPNTDTLVFSADNEEGFALNAGDVIATIVLSSENAWLSLNAVNFLISSMSPPSRFRILLARVSSEAMR